MTVEPYHGNAFLIEISILVFVFETNIVFTESKLLTALQCHSSNFKKKSSPDSTDLGQNSTTVSGEINVRNVTTKQFNVDSTRLQTSLMTDCCALVCLYKLQLRGLFQS